MTVDDDPIDVCRHAVVEGLGFVHLGSLMRANQMHGRHGGIAVLAPIAAGSLGVIVYQGDGFALLGIRRREVGGDGGFATAPLAVDDENPERVRIHCVALSIGTLFCRTALSRVVC